MTTNGIHGHANGVHALAEAPKPLDVAAVLTGKRLLILGGTGFLGKIFWLMLLDRYPVIEKIYLLVRSSKEMTSEERFWKKIVTSEAMKPLREKLGSEAFDAFVREKIIPVDGDLSREMCGVDPDVIRELHGTIDAVVNVAGVIEFNSPLDESIHANAFGAKNLISLCRALGETKLVHTSTCFVAGHRVGPIFEEDPCTHPFPRCEELGSELWDPEREIAECLDLIDQANHRCNDAFRQSGFAEQARKNLETRGEPSEGRAFDEELAKVRRKFVSDWLIVAGKDRAQHWGWHNTYTYTKSIGEQIIAKSGIPFVIARPASCESTVAFPFPGWNDGMSTSSVVIYLALKGTVQIPGRAVPLDFIPTDMVVTGMVLSLVELLEGTHRPVYQFGMSDVNPATAERQGELIGLYKRRHFQKKNTGNPLFNMAMSHMEAFAVDPKRFEMLGPPAVARATKTASKALKNTGIAPLRPIASALEKWSAQEKKLAEVLGMFAPFTSERNGPFDCSNTRAAYARLSPEDKAKLDWTPEKIDWVDWFLEIHMPAVEKWALPEMDRKLKREPKALRAHDTLVTLLDQMAERHGISTALARFETDGFAPLSYREVRDLANATAAKLHDLGVKKGDRVVLTAKNSPAWPIAYFGILTAGATAVPVDPAIETDALANIVHESHAKIAFADRDLEITDITNLPIHELLESRGETPTWERPEVLPEDLASLIFTSGTTGKPKGVMLTHANFTSLIAALAPIFPLNRGDRVLSVLPLHHTFEFTCGLLLPLSRGARIAYLDELNADRLGAAMKQGRITAMVGVPALWQMLERRILSQVSARGPVARAIFEWAGEMNRSLGKATGLDAGKIVFGPVHAALGGNIKYLISGGAALPRETSDLFAGMGLHLTEGYGLTEAAPVLTVSKPSPKTKAGHVGKPIPGVEVKIDSPDDRGVGEVYARGPNVMLGYTDSEATDRVKTADGWLKTGDLGKVDKHGQLQIVGRLKDVVVTATGENVYPDDVENRLGNVPFITELAIVGLQVGGGETSAERLACLAVPAGDENVERAERMDRAMRSLKDAIGKLPFGQQPSVVHLYDASLPRTATRKVKRAEVQGILRRMVGASTPPAGEEAEVSLVVSAIASVSGRSIREVHAHAALQADLGFDSLMLTELLEVLEAKGDAIDPAALQACRTVEDVERLAGDRRARGASDARDARAVSRTKKIEKSDPIENLKLPPALQDQAKSIIGKFQDLFYGEMMQPEVFGRAFIPHNRNTIVVANHASHLDMGFVRHALGTYGEDIVSLAAQDYFFEKGIQRAFFENFTNLKSLDRKGGLRQSLRQAGEVIEQGRTVLLFPEGTRSETGEIQEFKPMVGHLALTHGVDILPVFLGGTHSAMPKGSKLPTSRRIIARIGVPLRVADMRRLTAGMSAQDAAREVARLAREAVLALREAKILDLARASKNELAASREHPLVGVFQELEQKFKKENVSRPVSFYFTLGGDAFAKWTVKIDSERCEIKLGKPDGGTADCVLKTSADIFTKIVRESYVPSPTEFLSGAIKSNDVTLLENFQKAFQLA